MALIAQHQPGRVRRLILEDTPPPARQNRAVRERPDGPLPFDWPVVPAIIGQVNDPDPAWRERLADITAPTLLISGGPDSPIPAGQLADAAARLPAATIVTIPAGHHVHSARPAEFATAVLEFARG